MALTVTIGRNIGDDPMTAAMWAGFQVDALFTVIAHSTEVLFSGEGRGAYEGMYEDSYTIVARDAGFNETQALKQKLSKLAAQYGQECIALTAGETTLAYA